MSGTKRGLTAKESCFCILFSALGNACEAAEKAGYDQPEKAGYKLLARNDICKQIEALYGTYEAIRSKTALSGYRRLAFGSVEGAVRLLFADDPAALLDKGCSLFNVAEIKRPKEGALEIKFFDRMKALEKLEEQSEEEHRVSDFYRAVAGIRDPEDDRGQEEL